MAKNCLREDEKKEDKEIKEDQDDDDDEEEEQGQTEAEDIPTSVRAVTKHTWHVTAPVPRPASNSS